MMKWVLLINKGMKNGYGCHDYFLEAMCVLSLSLFCRVEEERGGEGGGGDMLGT